MGGQPPAKRNLLPWLLGCGGCGGLVVLGVVLALVIPALSRRSHGGRTEPVAAEDTVGTTLYTSSEAELAEQLREHYVPFSFRYPEGWQVVERGDQPDSKNFVKVEKAENGSTAENFSVGYMYATTGHESDPLLITQLLNQSQEQFNATFPNFQRGADDHMTLGGREATGFKFTARPQTENGEVQIFGRVLVIPVGEGKGLLVVMLGTSKASDLRGVDDLGVKGGLPVILRTFRIGDAAESGVAGKPGESEAADSTSPDATPSGKPQAGEKPGANSDGSVDESQLPEIRRVDEDSSR